KWTRQRKRSGKLSRSIQACGPRPLLQALRLIRRNRMTRRHLLKFAAAATAAPALLHSPGAVAAQASGPAPAPGPADEIAMLIYPGFTALDLVGPYHFLGGMPRARVHLVSNQADLRPVSSDIGLAVQPTATL